MGTRTRQEGPSIPSRKEKPPELPAEVGVVLEAGGREPPGEEGQGREVVQAGEGGGGHVQEGGFQKGERRAWFPGEKDLE